MKQTQTSSFEGKRVYRVCWTCHTCVMNIVITPSTRQRGPVFQIICGKRIPPGIFLDIVSTNMNASLDTSDTKPLEDSSNRLISRWIRSHNMASMDRWIRGWMYLPNNTASRMDRWMFLGLLRSPCKA
ncbi:hypothetical protein TNCV_4968671 [Trichonephila clavipes]|nr:hypothetical protein TNCV_4968671 [Trichonephila clavipes]